MPDTATRNAAARAVWAAGDYDAVAQLIWDVGARIVRRLEVRPGEDLLDVACGTGNAAVRGAAAGARVVGLDLTPELFVAARRRAQEAGVAVEWVEGDAEALPFADARFDVVVSTFGAMFTPRQEVAAAELARVVRPGGRLGLCSWTPEGSVGAFFGLLAAHVPPPPGPPPTRWGSEEFVEGLFAGTGLEFTFEREVVVLRAPSVEDAVSLYETRFGPVIAVRRQLEPEGRWPAMQEELAALLSAHNTATDGTLAYPAEYLVAVARAGS